MRRVISSMQAKAAYAILVREAGANPDEDAAYAFIHAVSHPVNPTAEFRFMGHLGSGGKFRNNGNSGNVPHVDCYQDDLTPSRQACINATNAHLRVLFRE